MNTQVENLETVPKQGLFERVKDINERERFAAHVLKGIAGDPSPRLARCVEYVLSDQCVHDLERLRTGDYFLDYPTKFLIPKVNSDRKRTLYLFANEDEAALVRLIAYGLRPVCVNFPETLYSFRPDVCCSTLIHRAHEACKNQELYALRTDIREYSCCIKPEKALVVAKRFFEDDPEAYAFLEWNLMRKKCYEDGQLIDYATGSLPGTAISNFFMSIYLIDIDAKINALEGCRFYGRYADDILAFFDSEEDLLEGKRLLDEGVEEYGLAFNEDKTYIHAPGESVEIMGFQLEGSEIHPSRRTIERLKKRLRRRARAVSIQKSEEGLSADEAGRIMVDVVNKTFSNPNAAPHEVTWIRWSFPVITQTDSLKELDAFAQRCIRYVMTGTWGKGGYRVKYSRLRALGYHPLVSKYYRSKV